MIDLLNYQADSQLKESELLKLKGNYSFPAGVHVIAQDDDNDYEESGYIAVITDEGIAAITNYSHCSCYGTAEAVDGKWMWQGTPDELVRMAELEIDPAWPGGIQRRAYPQDFDYDHLMKVYDQIREWNRKGRPL